MPSSHVGDWAKGCLMARAHATSKAAYFAVCRTADNNRIQVQYRLKGDDDAQAAGYGDGIDMDARLKALAKTVSTGGYHDNGISETEAISYVRFVASKGSTAFTAFASRDGTTWTHIYGPVTFDEPLTLKGVSATAHGDDAVLWRFTQFRIGNAPQDPSGSNWTHWLIGDGGHPSKAECRTGTAGTTSCSFPHGPDGNARRYGWASGWGE
ncbi:MAG TPA: hypothetical protein VG889_13355 [Rhizomicrobium sp.]|nr:hypothetical protein [Rhizomicrobium sp.]